MPKGRPKRPVEAEETPPPLKRTRRLSTRAAAFVQSVRQGAALHAVGEEEHPTKSHAGGMSSVADSHTEAKYVDTDNRIPAVRRPTATYVLAAAAAQAHAGSITHRSVAC